MAPVRRAKAIDLWIGGDSDVHPPGTGNAQPLNSSTTPILSQASTSTTLVNNSQSSNVVSPGSPSLGKRKVIDTSSVDKSRSQRSQFIRPPPTPSRNRSAISNPYRSPARFQNDNDSDDFSDLDSSDEEEENRTRTGLRDGAAPSGVNVDKWVLRPENQSPVCVTQLVAALASPYFANLSVVSDGAAPLLFDAADGPAEKNIYENPAAQRYLQKLLDQNHGPRAKVSFPENPYAAARANRRRIFSYHSLVKIDGVIYSVGDVLLTPAGQDGPRPPPRVPDKVDPKLKQAVGDFFWFGKILSIRADDKTAHVQWFQHGRRTILGELSNPQELYLTYMCDDLDLTSVVGKANVQYIQPGKRPKTWEYENFFYSFAYDQLTATFEDIATDPDIEQRSPPNNCACCIRSSKKKDSETSNRTVNGFRLYEIEYHVHDMVFIRTYDGSPCRIGHIIDIQENKTARADQDPFIVMVRIFGFYLDLKGAKDNISENMCFQDRHLYLTNEICKCESHGLIRKCSVLHRSVIHLFEDWLAISPYHFFIKYHIPDHPDERPNARISAALENLEEISVEEFGYCKPCVKEEIKSGYILEEFLEQTEPLRVFAPHAGVGAFELSMSVLGHMKTTHAIEISPSAAQTLKLNSPETIVYNQCTSQMLEYAIKYKQRQRGSLCQIDDKNKLLPPPPGPEDIDMIVSGFPCQPHSSLNMFQKADDIKSDQILNVLAWVDFIKPKWCYFENVRGFMNFNLGAMQASKYRVTGGVEKGGLRFVVRVLVTLGYQVRFCLLQAAHYGSPQSRVRFFLIAAKHGYPLPKIPEPTHNFLLKDKLKMKFPEKNDIVPIDTSWGRAPHQYTSVSEAIDDLQKWHWRNPPLNGRTCDDDGTLLIACRTETKRWGPTGNNYQCDPQSPYQARLRRGPRVKNLQHFTNTFTSEVVDRANHIPPYPGMNYRSLYDRPDLWQYQFASPLSSAGRKNHRTLMYARLDPDGWFSTTVTNVDPTAKQAKILHPTCSRIVTVRELARSQGFPDHFEFISVYDDVKMMHRQIGNAVPWQVGEALGRELLQARVDNWQKKRKERHRDVVVNIENQAA